jgi:hypothetical protein
MTGSATPVSPSEDQIFDTVWAFVSGLFDASLSAQIMKANQNQTPTPLGTYAIVQPGVKMRTDQAVRGYTPPATGVALGTQNVSRGTQYGYQIDCYGPAAPDWADTIAIAWRSMWGADWLASGTDASGNPLAALGLAPLYADEPQQLTITNGEHQYEQRFMLRLYLQVHQTVALQQSFFTGAPAVVVEPPADLVT